MQLLNNIRVALNRGVKRIRGSVKYKIVSLQKRPRWPEENSRFDYQKLFNKFEILSDSVVLDIGCGGYPFPLATVLTDRNIGPTAHRTEKIVLDERPFVISDIEHLPFDDKSIDYVYCSHLLEHVDNPILACSELVRVGKRGYIETPTMGKDMLFAWENHMHKWHVVSIANRLLFFEYSVRQRKGSQSDAWRKAIFADHYDPLQSLYYNNSDLFNVMFTWTDGFECIVYYLDGRVENKSLR